MKLAVRSSCRPTLSLSLSFPPSSLPFALDEACNTHLLTLSLSLSSVPLSDAIPRVCGNLRGETDRQTESETARRPLSLSPSLSLGLYHGGRQPSVLPSFPPSRSDGLRRIYRLRAPSRRRAAVACNVEREIGAKNNNGPLPLYCQHFFFLPLRSSPPPCAMPVYWERH